MVTLESWLKPDTKSLPIASPLLRLWFFFDVATDGEMPALRDMNVEGAEYTDFIARAVAHNVIGLDTALELCGLSGNVHHVWVYLRGEAIPNKPPFTLQELKASYESKLRFEQEKLRAEIEASKQKKPIEATPIETVDALLETVFSEAEAETVEELVPEPASEPQLQPEVDLEPPAQELESEPDEISEPEAEPSEAVVLPPEVVDDVSQAQQVPEKVLPVDVLLTVAGSLSAVLPHIRHLAGQFDSGLVEEWLNEYFGADAASDIVEFLGYSVSPVEVEEVVPDTVVSSDVVSRTAKALRELAPDIDVLFDDETSEGALSRQRLRDEVGNELFSNLAVKVTALRSRQGYDKARNGEVN